MSEFSYIDETGNRQTLSVEGWRIGIECSAGEIMNCDLIVFILMMYYRGANVDGTFKHSLLKFDDAESIMFNPPDWWIDIYVEKR